MWQMMESERALIRTTIQNRLEIMVSAVLARTEISFYATISHADELLHSFHALQNY